MTTIALGPEHPTIRPHVARYETIAMAIAFAGALLPIVAGVIAAVVDGWIPIGDNAYFLIRSRDVLTDHHPLLGAWSSGSASVGEFVNNPGPLQLDLLAPFTKIGGPIGTAFGVAFTNVLALVGVGWGAFRLGGAFFATTALAGAASVTWSMGTAMLIEPRQHPALVLPFLCFLVLVWALAAGRAWALPWAVLAGSLLVQTHLSYALLGPLLGAWGAAGFAWHGRRAWRAGEAEWSAWRLTTRRSAMVAGIVAAVCWIQPLIDQLWGRQNLTHLLRASGRGSGPGLGTGARIVADVVGLPPFWGRPSFRDVTPAEDLAGLGPALLALLVIAAVLAVGLVRSWRSGRTDEATGVATAIVAVAGAVVSAARLPVEVFGLAVANYRWLWAIGAFWAVTAVVALWPRGLRPRSWGLWGLAAAAAVMGLAGAPASNQINDSSQDDHHLAVSRDLVGQLGPLAERDLGPLLVDRENSPFGEPYTLAVIGELQTLGIDFRFTNPHEEYRFGTGRLPDGHERYRLSFAHGDFIAELPPDSEPVAVTTGIEDVERAELAVVEAGVLSALADGSLVVDLEAATPPANEEFRTLRAAVAGRPVRQAALHFELAKAESRGLVSGSDDVRAELSRFHELVGQRLSGSVAVYLTPLS